MCRNIHTSLYLVMALWNDCEITYIDLYKSIRICLYQYMARVSKLGVECDVINQNEVGEWGRVWLISNKDN